MEALVVLCFFGTCVYGLVSLGRRAVESVRATARRRRMASDQQRATDQRLLQQAQQRRAVAERASALATRLRQALSQLGTAPDFRRAGNWASHASDLPARMRHRLFVEFRPQLVRHFAARLTTGEDATVLLESLRELVTHLGIAAFEADYIQQEAERRVGPRNGPGPQSYDQRFRQAEREHENRVSVLRNLTSLDQETRQQLLEAEESRFRQTLLELGGGEN